MDGELVGGGRRMGEISKFKFLTQALTIGTRGQPNNVHVF